MSTNELSIDLNHKTINKSENDNQLTAEEAKHLLTVMMRAKVRHFFSF